ncbi:MAG: hypothetical protein K6G04_00580 [Lachnospiraceae bacterium]|nr:hypothetical protein [Lachnospiraceae bacterium]
MEQSLFVEQIVARRNPPMTKVTLGIMVALTVFVGLNGILFLQPVILVMFLILLALLYFMYLQVNIEYEYSVTDGELDIDIIRWQRKRKHLLTIPMESVVVIAPGKSEPVSAYSGRNLKTYDCTAHDATHRYYTLVFKPQGSTTEEKLLFEPDERVLDNLWRKAPSKVHKEA